MNGLVRCSQCGAELAADAPKGLCAACLLKRGLATQSSPPSRSERPADDFVPPTAAELAAHFPDLEILKFVGRGGMGMVYRARQKGLDRLVALKILLPTIASDAAFAERFVREARAMARLSHPNIVAVYDFGESDGLYYFLMEYVDGLTLGEVLQAGQLKPTDALAVVPQICEALQYAHDNGVVHRDIKPANILMDRQGRVKIADFGLAKLVGRPAQDVSLTGTGQVMGTPHYMAPEQIEHPQQVDHRADIYSLGVVFYQMLTGELPLGRFAPPSKKVTIDVRLDEVVLRALEREPELRYQQASQVKSEVETILTSPPMAGAPAPTPEEVGAIEQARSQVRGPALGLLVTGILNWIIAPPMMLAREWYLLSATSTASALPVPTPQEAFQSQFLVAMLLAILFISSLMVVAAMRMKRLESYRLAIAGSILAMVVSPGSVLGLPIGIWSLLVLSRRDVRAAFRLNRTGRSGSGILWSPFQSPAVREICAHMTAAERMDAALQATLYGFWACATAGLPIGLAVYASHLGAPLGWGLAGAGPLLLLHILFIPTWRRKQREFLCSTTWAKQQGITPEQLVRRSWWPASWLASALGKNLSVLFAILLATVPVAAGVLLWVQLQLAETPLPTEPSPPFAPLDPAKAASGDTGSPRIDRAVVTAGFRFQLQAAKRDWAVGEMPRFTAGVLYSGPPITVPITLTGCLLEMDGLTWMLRQSAAGEPASMELTPGAALEYSFRFQRDQDGRGLHLTQLKGDAPLNSYEFEAFDLQKETVQMKQRFTLAPGVHVMRVGTRAFQSPDGPAPTIWSNSVTIEILGDAKKQERPANRQSESQGPVQPASDQKGASLPLAFHIVPNPAGTDRKPTYPQFVGKTERAFVAAAVKELAEKGPSATHLHGAEFGWFELAPQVVVPGAVAGEYRGSKYILLCAQEPYVLRSKSAGKDAWGLKEVSAGRSSHDFPTIDIRLDQRGGELFAALTKANLQNRLAVVAAGRVVAAPTIMSQMSGRTAITGQFSDKEVESLVRALDAGIRTHADSAQPPAKPD